MATIAAYQSIECAPTHEAKSPLYCVTLDETGTCCWAVSWDHYASAVLVSKTIANGSLAEHWHGPSCLRCPSAELVTANTVADVDVWLGRFVANVIDGLPPSVEPPTPEDEQRWIAEGAAYDGDDELNSEYDYDPSLEIAQWHLSDAHLPPDIVELSRRVLLERVRELEDTHSRPLPFDVSSFEPLERSFKVFTSEYLENSYIERITGSLLLLGKQHWVSVTSHDFEGSCWDASRAGLNWVIDAYDSDNLGVQDAAVRDSGFRIGEAQARVAADESKPERSSPPIPDSPAIYHLFGYDGPCEYHAARQRRPSTHYPDRIAHREFHLFRGDKSETVKLGIDERIFELPGGPDALLYVHVASPGIYADGVSAGFAWAPSWSEEKALTIVKELAGIFGRFPSPTLKDVTLARPGLWLFTILNPSLD